jgi:hypothetical protein
VGDYGDGQDGRSNGPGSTLAPSNPAREHDHGDTSDHRDGVGRPDNANGQNTDEEMKVVSQWWRDSDSDVRDASEEEKGTDETPYVSTT